MSLTTELNHHLRRAMIEIRIASELDDREQGLKVLDLVTEEIDGILIDLVPTASAERAPRLARFRENQM